MTSPQIISFRRAYAAHKAVRTGTTSLRMRWRNPQTRTGYLTPRSIYARQSHATFQKNQALPDSHPTLADCRALVKQETPPVRRNLMPER